MSMTSEPETVRGACNVRLTVSNGYPPRSLSCVPTSSACQRSEAPVRGRSRSARSRSSCRRAATRAPRPSARGSNTGRARRPLNVNFPSGALCDMLNWARGRVVRDEHRAHGYTGHGHRRPCPECWWPARTAREYRRPRVHLHPRCARSARSIARSSLRSRSEDSQGGTSTGPAPCEAGVTRATTVAGMPGAAGGWMGPEAIACSIASISAALRVAMSARPTDSSSRRRGSPPG